MRVALMGDGMSIHTQRWARWLRQEGIEVHLITLRPVELPGVVCHAVPARFGKADYLLAAGAVRAAVRGIAPDILHVQSVTGYGALALACAPIPTVVTAWGSDVLVQPERSLLYRWLVGRVLRRAAAVTVEARHVAEHIRRRYPFARDVLVIPWGIDGDVFGADVPVRSAARVDWGLPVDGPILLSVRSAGDLYNTTMILQAFAQVVVDLPAARLVLIRGYGHKPYFSGLRKLASDLSITANVRFVDETLYPEQIRSLMAAVNAVVSIPASDSYPISVLEAMQCGAAAVLSDIPANRELVASGFRAGIANPHDTVAVKEAMLTVLRTDPAEAYRIVSANRALIKYGHIWSANSHKIMQLYKTLAEGRTAE